MPHLSASLHVGLLKYEEGVSGDCMVNEMGGISWNQVWEFVLWHPGLYGSFLANLLIFHHPVAMTALVIRRGA